MLSYFSIVYPLKKGKKKPGLVGWGVKPIIRQFR